jgi:hypothetical protein
MLAVISVALVVLAVTDPFGHLQAQAGAAIETTLEVRYLSADDIGTARETDLLVRVIGDSGAPASGASVQWTSSDPTRVMVGPLNGATSAQGTAVTRLVAQPRAARGPVVINIRATLPNGVQLSKAETVYIAGSLSRLAPLTPSLNFSGPGDRQKLIVALLDSTGQPAADGVPVAFQITTQNPLNVVTFVEMPGPFASVKSKDGRAEVTVHANQLGTATIRVQAGTVTQEIGAIVGTIATPTPTPTPVATPSPTVEPTVAPPSPTAPVPATGTWDPAPQAGVWALTYWQGPDSPIESAAQATAAATAFWVLRNEAGAIRFFGYSKTSPEASDAFTVRRGEAAFAR